MDTVRDTSAQLLHEQELHVAHESPSLLLKVPYGSARDELKGILTSINDKLPHTEVLGTSSPRYLTHVDYLKCMARSGQ